MSKARAQWLYVTFMSRNSSPFTTDDRYLISPILTNFGLLKSNLKYDCKCVTFHNFSAEMSKMADV